MKTRILRIDTNGSKPDSSLTQLVIIRAISVFILLTPCVAAKLRAQDASPSGTVAPLPVSDEIPKGYEIGEDTLSPDRQLAILYPLQGTQDKNDNYPPNLLVRLKPYAVIAPVEKEGLPQNVTTELNAQWNGNSMVAIWEYRRWGIVDLNIYEIENDKVTRVQPVWREALKIFERDFRNRFLKTYPREDDSFIIVSEHSEKTGRGDFQFKGRQLILDLRADNKPGGAPGPDWTAKLQATWNLDAGKFDKVHFWPGEIHINPEAE
jgi:hypothetical protein